MKRGFVLAGLILLLSACAQQGARPADPRTDLDANEAERRSAMRVELAGGYLARAQYNIALDEVKQALQLKPDSREGLNLRALILAGMGEHAAAEEGFRRTLALYPNDADTLHNLGWYHCQLKQWGPAGARFDEALAQPSYRAPARTWLAKGVCEQRAGMLEPAERSLMRAFELDPASPMVSQSLADLLLQLRQHERARFYVARVNARDEQRSPQSLWLATRIEHRLANRLGVTEWGQRLLREFPQSPEAEAYRGGRFE